jgi:hypothetical protein
MIAKTMIAKTLCVTTLLPGAAVLMFPDGQLSRRWRRVWRGYAGVCTGRRHGNCDFEVPAL